MGKKNMFRRGRMPGRMSVLTAMLALASPAGHATPQPATGTGVSAPPPMVLDAGQDRLKRMTVDVFINGQGPFPFAVDTGAERTAVSASLAKRLGLVADRSARLHSIAGVDTVRTAHVATLQIGSRRVDGIRAPILPDGPLGVAGLLGIDALTNQRVVMDFVDERMSVRPSATRDPRDRDTIVVTARRRFGQLVLVDASVDGQRVYAIVDSGSQVTVGNAALRQRLSRRKRGADTPTEIIGVTGLTLPANYSVLPEMKIGSVKLGNIPIVYSDAHPFKKFGLTDKPALLLGTDLLRAFERVSLDFDTKKVRFLLRSEESNGGGHLVAD